MKRLSFITILIMLAFATIANTKSTVTPLPPTLIFVRVDEPVPVPLKNTLQIANVDTVSQFQVLVIIWDNRVGNWVTRLARNSAGVLLKSPTPLTITVPRASAGGVELP